MGGRATTYRWEGLDVDSVYWVRVNEQVADGRWVPSGTARIFTPCGSKPLPAGAQFNVVSFSDTQNNSPIPPANATAAGGTMQSCNPKLIKTFVELSGITDDASVYFQFFAGNTALTGALPWAFSEGDARFTHSQAGSGQFASGFTPGTYSLLVYSGEPGSFKELSRGSFTLACS